MSRVNFTGRDGAARELAASPSRPRASACTEATDATRAVTTRRPLVILSSEG